MERGATAPLGLLHDLDALGKRIATRLPDGRTVNWLHYGSGHLHQINLDGEVVCDLERDALHREITRTQGALHSRYRLDPEGRLLHQQTERSAPDKTAPVQGGLVIERRYAYDRAGQLTTIEDRRRGQLRYRYDALGRLTEALHGDGQRERFAFDPAHNLIEPNGAALPDNRLTVFEDKRYRYDERGNLLEKKIGAREVQRFRWDPDNQLVEARTSRHVGEKQQERVTRYAYDPLGRRIAKLDGQGKPKQVFLWDGNRLLVEAQRDAASERSRLYLYEPESFAPMALVDAVTRLGAEADAGASTKTVMPLAMPAQATSDEDDFAAELKRAKAMLNRPSKEQLAQTKALGEATQQLTPAEREGKAPQPRPTAQRILYYHCDHLGTPQELTDRQGNIVWAADYAAWGKVRKIERPGPKPRGGPAASGGFGGLGAAGLGHSSAGRFPTHGNAALQPVFDEDAAANEAVFAEPIEQHLRFQGQYFDAETGLHYNRFRYYDPECGRFVSLDPIGLDGGTNQFHYTPNPTGWIDPLGLAGAGTGGAYMFEWKIGGKYIGKGEKPRMQESMRTKKDKRNPNECLLGAAHVSTGGDNDLGKMAEYKAMKMSGFERGNIPAEYANGVLSGESTWNANPGKQGEATRLATELIAKFEANKAARALAAGKCKTK